MLFVISKILLFLLFPITWIFVLFIAALLSKNSKQKQRLLITALVLLYIFSAPVLLNLFARIWDYKPTVLNINSTYSCAIILGGFASEKADSTGYFNGASDRFIQALKLRATGKASHILISSGNASINPDGFSEGIWVKRQLKLLNVPDSAVLIESKSRNTIENALFTKKLLADKSLAPPYLLVTSAFHMRRAMLIFKKAGLPIIPYPCNYSDSAGKISFDSLIPSAGTLAHWETYTKELVGIVVAYLKNF